MINVQVLQGQWNEVKGSLKSHWGALTNDDLRAFNGDIDQLIGKIQRKTGESREAVEEFLSELSADAASAVSSAAEVARGFARSAVGSARDAYGNVADQFRGHYEDAQEVVRTRPAESLLVAFGAGIFAGLIAGLFMRQR